MLQGRFPLVGIALDLDSQNQQFSLTSDTHSSYDAGNVNFSEPLIPPG